MADGKGKLGGREVVIVEAVRTPVGRGHPEKGYYKDLHPSNLLAKTYSELISRAGIDPAEVGDVIAGCVQQWGEQAINIGRNAWLEAGLPEEVPATTVDRQCGSAQQAVNFAATLIASGVHDVAIGGGVEHMGKNSFAAAGEIMAERGMAFSPELMERYDLIPQGLSAEMIADKWEIPRSELDEFGVRSQALAQQATEEGRFEREMIPFQVNGDTYVTDQGLRETTLEGLAALKPAFKEDGRITAGNSSQVSDGAAAVLLMTREKADALGLKPRARIYDITSSSEPSGSGPGLLACSQVATSSRNPCSDGDKVRSMARQPTRAGSTCPYRARRHSTSSPGPSPCRSAPSRGAAW